MCNVTLIATIAGLKQFFAMGGYAWYVWLSYGVVCLTLSINILLPRRKLRQLRLKLAQLRLRDESNT